MRLLARWLPALSTRAAPLDTSSSSPGHTGGRASWYQGRSARIDEHHIEIAAALDVQRRLADPRVRVALRAQAETSCALCHGRSDTHRAGAVVTTVGDVAWFAFGRHGEAFPPAAIVQHVGWHFATENRRQAWGNTRSRALRAAQVGAFGQTLLVAACAAYEHFDTNADPYAKAIQSIEDLLTT